MRHVTIWIYLLQVDQKLDPPRTLIGSQMPMDHIETFTKVFELSLIFEDFEMEKAKFKYILIPLT